MEKWQSLWCMEVNSEPAIIVLFGAAGDLAMRKLYPALFALYRQGLIHESTRIIGCARRDWSREEYCGFVGQTLGVAAQECANFLEIFDFVNCDYSQEQSYVDVKQILDKFDRSSLLPYNHLFYLALPAKLYPTVTSHLAHAKLLGQGTPWRHILLEKPFGYDLKSAQKLNRLLHRHLDEDQIYRIDHYLGKETVQNISMLRFANLIFEPIWNRKYIEAVKITVAESIGVEGRGGYFDGAGIVRDMFQNHILEMLSLVAMEMPASSRADDIRNEKLKLIHSIRGEGFVNPQNSFVRGQYGAGGDFVAYKKEVDVAPNSQTETFLAAQIFVDNWRWSQVPFYIRSGKRMASARSEIAIQFKAIPHNIFSPLNTISYNELHLQVSPTESMSLTLNGKSPGPKLCMGEMNLEFAFPKNSQDQLDAYARLILDALLADQSLFIRDDIIDASWELFTPLLESWQVEPEKSPLYIYSAGSDGPVEANNLLQKNGHYW